MLFASFILKKMIKMNEPPVFRMPEHFANLEDIRTIEANICSKMVSHCIFHNLIEIIFIFFFKTLILTSCFFLLVLKTTPTKLKTPLVSHNFKFLSLLNQHLPLYQFFVSLQVTSISTIFPPSQLKLTNCKTLPFKTRNQTYSNLRLTSSFWTF